MKKYKVTLYLMLHPEIDGTSDNPKTMPSVHHVEAETKSRAYMKANELETSLMSVFNYTVEGE
jgi:hypothetical protein